MDMPFGSRQQPGNFHHPQNRGMNRDAFGSKRHGKDQKKGRAGRQRRGDQPGNREIRRHERRNRKRENTTMSKDNYLAKIARDKQIADRTTQLEQKTRVLLNKITPEKYDRVTAKLKLLIDELVVSEDMLKAVVKQIFEVAREQHNFAKLYAKLCKDLNEHALANLDVEQTPVDGSTDGKKQRIFRRHLLGFCQQFFEEWTGNDVDDAQLSEIEVRDRQAKAKARIMGNVKFIG